jgi:LysM repeat protein
MAVLALPGGFLAGRAGADGEAPDPVRSYVVQPGDTLWDVAVRFGGEQADPRPYVDFLVDANDIENGLILPGQVLTIDP